MSSFSQQQQQQQQSKQYGLIKKPIITQNKGNIKTINKKPSIFNNNDDDDNDDDIEKINEKDNNIAIKRANQLILSSKSNVSSTLLDDISMYDYDGSYDTFKNNNDNDNNKNNNHPLLSSSDGSSNLPKPKPKYIESIIATSKIREKEQERMKERKLVRERQKEDELYGDTEKFMTSAYKKKLEEEKKWEYEDKLTDIVEQKTDYRSRGMHGFYSNLMNKNVSTGADVSANALSAYTAGSLRQNQLDTNQNLGIDNDNKSNDNNNDNKSNGNNNDISHKRSVEESNIHDDDEILKKQKIVSLDKPINKSEKMNNNNNNNNDDDNNNNDNNNNDNNDDNNNNNDNVTKIKKEESIMSARERFLARKNNKST